jgi:hypothetical protein
MNWRYWLSNEAVSNYIVFALGLLTAAVAFLAKKLWAKPDIVEVEREASVSLLNLEERARQRLKITYEGREVDSFHETTFRIRNRASRVLEDIELRLVFDPKVRQDLYDVTIEDPLGSSRTSSTSVKCTVEDDGSHYLHIKVPFLNPYQKYKDEIAIRLYAPLQVVALAVVGGGRGWAGKFFDRVAYNEKLTRLIRDSSSISELVARVALSGFLRRGY